jgi:hypothetical protein
MTKTTTFRMLLGLTGLMLLALPSTSHAARAVSVLSPPEVYDMTAPRAAEATEPTGHTRCYVEPKGFRNNIHFNPPCATAPRDAHPPMPGGRNKETGGNHNHS